MLLENDSSRLADARQPDRGAVVCGRRPANFGHGAKTSFDDGSRGDRDLVPGSAHQVWLLIASAMSSIG